jgi:hypothetical protein
VSSASQTRTNGADKGVDQILRKAGHAQNEQTVEKISDGVRSAYKKVSDHGRRSYQRSCCGSTMRSTFFERRETDPQFTGNDIPFADK